MTEVAPATRGAASLELPRLAELDGVRGFALLLVLTWHYIVLHAAPERGTLFGKLCMLLRGSWTGVDLFFVLSGFLLGSILLRNREQPGYYRVFYTRRFLRILPLYFLGLLAILVLSLFPATPPKLQAVFATPHPWWSLAFLLQNFSMAWQGTFGGKAFSVTWSLCVEEQFYLLLPLLIRLCPPRKLPVLLLVMVGLGTLVRIGLVHFWPSKAPLACYVLLPARWDPLLLGVLGAWLFQAPQGKLLLGRHQRWLPLLLGLSASGLAWLTLSARITILSVDMTRYGSLVLGGTYLVLLLTLATNQIPMLGSIFRWRWLRWLGLVSYGAYLFHEPVHGVMHAILGGDRGENLTGPRAWLITGASLVVTLLIASLSWRYFESRFVAKGHRLAYGRRDGPQLSQSLS